MTDSQTLRIMVEITIAAIIVFMMLMWMIT